MSPAFRDLRGREVEDTVDSRIPVGRVPADDDAPVDRTSIAEAMKKAAAARAARHGRAEQDPEDEQDPDMRRVRIEEPGRERAPDAIRAPSGEVYPVMGQVVHGTPTPGYPRVETPLAALPADFAAGLDALSAALDAMDAAALEMQLQAQLARHHMAALRTRAQQDADKLAKIDAAMALLR